MNSLKTLPTEYVFKPENIKTSTGKSIHSEHMIVNFGPQHPATHGVLRLEVVLDGEIVVDVIPHIGYLHRCFEKHAENMTNYQQVIPYCDRMDYLASMNNDWGYALTIERMLKIEVPQRVEYIRVIMAEFQRITSHLVAVATFGIDTGAFTPFLWCFRDREMILSLIEMTCGARLLYNYIWVGGLSHDLPPTFIEKANEFCNYFLPKLKEFNDVLTYNEILIKRCANVGVLPKEVAINYGCSGPMLRASGVEWDLRRNDPYGVYDKFEWDICVGKGEMGTVGDTWDRHIVRCREMEQSVRIIKQALAGIPEGDVRSAIPKRIRPEKSEIYVRTESPRGELGYYVISDGSATPFRVKARTPSFANLSVLPEILRGAMVADLVAAAASVDIVLGDVDR
jgi:NADH-quinone oxidoreductase subunit D